MNITESRLASYNQPMYKIEIKAYLCSFEIEVNDIPSFSYFDEPQIATDIPINSLIFSSGKQNVKFRIYPLYNNLTLHKDSKIEINIFVKEANDFYLKKEIIASYKIQDSMENRSFFESAFSFDATISYTLNMRKLVHDFSNEDKDKLFSEIYSQYKILSNFIINDDLKNYLEFTKIRFNDFATAHYLDEDKKKYFSDKALYTFKDYNLILLPKEGYILKFCYDNKLVYLNTPKNSLGLILEDKTSVEEGLHFIESAILFRNNEGKLTLFR